MRRKPAFRLKSESLERRQLLSVTSFELDDIGYFLNPSVARIERYHLDTEAWLSPLPLQGASGSPNIVYGDAEGIYAAYGKAVYRYNPDGTGQTHLMNAQDNVIAIHSDGNLLFVNHTNGLYARFVSINKSTNMMIDTMENYVDSVAGSSISRETNRIFGRSQGVSPSDITFVSYNDAGEFLNGGGSPYHGDYPGGSRTWVFPGGAKVVDDSGTIYSTDNLNHLNSFGARINDLAFYGSDVPIVLTGSTLTAYTSSILPTGSTTLNYNPGWILVNDTNVVTFSVDATSPTGLTARLVPVTSLSAPAPGAPIDPNGLPYTPDKVEVSAEGKLLLLSKSHQSIFRWDPVNEQYDATIPLIGTPSYIAYSAVANTVYLAYNSGLIRKIDLNAAQLAEVPFATLPTPPLGLSTAGQYVFAVDGSGAWVSHHTFRPNGSLIEAVDWNYYSTEYVWSETNQKMYFFRDDTSPNDLLWEEINANGTAYPGETPGGIRNKFDSPLHGSGGFIHPIRVSPDGSMVLLGSGVIHDGQTLAVENTLTNSITDAAWLGNELFTVRDIAGVSQFQHWVQPTFFADDVIQRPGTPLALRTVAADRMVGISQGAGGVPSFLVLDANLNQITLNSAPTAVTLQNVVTTLAENSSTATAIKVADVSITDDQRGVNVLSVSGDDAAKFEIVGGALRIKAATILNFESRPNYTVTVNVDDPNVGSSPDASTTFSLSLTDVNEPPTQVALLNRVNSLPENTNTTDAIKVADVKVTDDALGTYVVNLSGPDAASFEVVGPTLRLRAGATLNFEAKTSHSITVTVDDATVGGTPDASLSYQLSVTNVNEPPLGLALQSATASLLENSNTSTAVKLADIVFSDDSLGSNRLTLSGPDAANFELFGTALRLRSSTVLDYESKPSYSVVVNLDDSTVGSSPDASVPFTLSLVDVNEAPTQVRLQNAVSSLSEEIDTTAALKLADIGITDDLPGDNALSLSGPDAALLEIVGAQLRLRAGVILDSQTNPTIDAVVNVDDAAVGSSPDAFAVVSIVVTPDNNNDPPIVALVDRIYSLPESTQLAESYKVGRIVIIDDGVGVNTVALAGPDAAAFEIDGSQLRLRAGTVLDYETKPAYNVTIHVDDSSVGSTPDASVYFTFSVSDEQEEQFVAASVVARRLFYNNSRFDNPQLGGNDDLAIAGEKQALLSGGTATFANYSSYSRGINGVMIDVANLAGTVGSDDFVFKVGNSSDISQWQLLSAAAQISVRPGAGAGGADRVTIVWPDRAILKTWLQVTVKANPDTGLLHPDVFYFGNAVGESGNTDGDTSVSITDELLARNNPANLSVGASVNNRFDYDRDGTVSIIDQILARNNITTSATELALITPPSAGLLSGQGMLEPLSSATPPSSMRELVAPAEVKRTAIRELPIGSAQVDVRYATPSAPRHANRGVLDDELLELLSR